MGRVFSSESTKTQRFWLWLKDLKSQLLSLPNYLNPPKLTSTPLTPQEEEEVNKILEEDENIVELKKLIKDNP